MNTDIESRREWRRSHRNPKSNRLAGVFLLGAGGLFLLSKMDVGLPRWLFSWQVMMIAIGAYLAIKHQFRSPVWIVFVLVGVLSLENDLFPFMHLEEFKWPLVLIALGLYFILRPNRRTHFAKMDNDALSFKTEPAVDYIEGDKLDVTAIFGSIKKVVVSKNFQGGDVVSVLGGSDINLSQADIHGKVRLEATNFMGGTKLIIPSSWDVQSELVAIFGGVEDKRDIRSTIINPGKVLILEGTCIFGGIEIRSY